MFVESQRVGRVTRDKIVSLIIMNGCVILHIAAGGLLFVTIDNRRHRSCENVVELYQLNHDHGLLLELYYGNIPLTGLPFHGNHKNYHIP